CGRGASGLAGSQRAVRQRIPGRPGTGSALAAARGRADVDSGNGNLAVASACLAGDHLRARRRGPAASRTDLPRRSLAQGPSRGRDRSAPALVPRLTSLFAQGKKTRATLATRLTFGPGNPNEVLLGRFSSCFN